MRERSTHTIYPYLLHPWLGTKKMDTLYFLLKKTFGEELEIQNISWAKASMGLHVTAELPADEFVKKLCTILKSLKAEQIIPQVQPICMNRYDPYISETLRQRANAMNSLDVEGIRAWPK